jgi:hypothetical protein
MSLTNGHESDGTLEQPGLNGHVTASRELGLNDLELIRAERGSTALTHATTASQSVWSRPSIPPDKIDKKIKNFIFSLALSLEIEERQICVVQFQPL